MAPPHRARAPSILQPLGGISQEAALGDGNGDGKLDLATTSESGSVGRSVSGTAGAMLAFPGPAEILARPRRLDRHVSRGAARLSDRCSVRRRPSFSSAWARCDGARTLKPFKTRWGLWRLSTPTPRGNLARAGLWSGPSFFSSFAPASGPFSRACAWSGVSGRFRSLCDRSIPARSEHDGHGDGDGGNRRPRGQPLQRNGREAGELTAISIVAPGSPVSTHAAHAEIGAPFARSAFFASQSASALGFLSTQRRR
jgi:hypothetical protein